MNKIYWLKSSIVNAEIFEHLVFLHLQATWLIVELMVSNRE